LSDSLKTTAEDLAALAEILELPKFSQLCQEVIDLLATMPIDLLPQLTSTTLSAWRRSQALVLTGNTNNLPNQLELPPSLRKALINNNPALNLAPPESDPAQAKPRCDRSRQS
jgi:hypothetical protein